MSPSKSLFGGKKNNPQTIQDYPLPPSCSVSNLSEFLADGNASFLRAARSGNLEKVIEFLKGNIDINTSNANGLNALHLAAKEGHVNVVTELLKRGANVNAATKKGNTALHIASLAGQEEVVKVLIQLGANVNVQSQNGFTPLYMAAQENHDQVVSFLLASGANQSLATEDGFTPLAVALQQGHDRVVSVLLENDTKGKVRLPALHIAAKKDDCKAATLLLQSDHNPDVTSKSGFTPLHIAAHYGNENIAKILLNKGADVNYAAKHQITPLHVASKWGKLNMVVLLLEKGANIDASTRDGLTPLHCAARSGHDMVVDLLLEKGAPFLAKTKNGLAPLHMASQGDHVDSARILLFHKAPVDDVTVDYLTALHVAAHCGHVKVAKLLLDRKADANARALNGFTPLHIACKKNRIKVVELLLKHGASIEATTESGLTPLHVASFMGCMNIVIYLIQNGANPDVPTVRGETPLHLAARANQTDIIRILLRNGASVDARAREEQTPLHIAARLGNVDIVSLLLQHGAAVDAVTKDMYTALHITAKEDQEEVAAALLDHGASLTATTKKGFTPLHLAAKYGNIKVARLLLLKGASVDAQGKNGVTPLHVAAHYDHVNVALLLLDKGASPHAMAKNGYTPLHIAAKKNQMDIASTLLEYGANTNSESKAGFTPLHLASQEGHADMSSLLIENKANVNHKANNGLTPLHLCAQDDRVNVAQVLVKNGAEICPQTKAGYTPLHVASHFGQINMVRFLLQNDANVHTVTSHGYTPLHQAAQQGHTLVVNLLLENQASPNVTTVQGQTPLSIAQRLGYISVVETLKVVTETTVTTTTTTVTEEKYKVVAPETMQETFMTDSEDEGGEEAMLGDQSYRYLTADEMKSLGDDSLPIDVTKDEKQHDVIQAVKQFGAPMVEEDNLSPQHGTPVESGFSEKFSPDNVDLAKAPVHAGRFSWDDAYFYYPPKGMLRSRFLVSFMVDARGGAMRGCRHSGVRVIIPPRKASMPMRITCRYLRKEKLIHPPPLMEGEACASRILEMGPVGARFLGPVIIEVPHFASTRGKEREITILRSDTGESWREHTLEASEEAVQEVLNESFEGEELSALEDLNTNRITRILTTDFPQYFAIVTRIRQEVHGVGPEGGMVSSTVVPQVQAIFPEGALTKKIRVGLQAQPIAPELVAKLLGNRVAVSPIVTVEPRRRKFHKPITLTIPVPQAATKGMINQYSGDAPTLRLLCSITGGSSKAQWEDVTGSTPLTFVNDCVSFTTTVSARFWLMDCRQVNEVTRFATELYQEAVYVPFMSKFVIFAKRHDPFEAQLRVFCMTDDKEDKTLETQEHFTEVAKSRDVEVLEGKLQYLEFAGNLVPVTKSGEQLKLTFQAFHENRLPFTIRVKDPHVEAMGRIAFMKEPKAGRGEPPQTPICNLNVALPEVLITEANADVLELVTLEKSYDFIQEAGLSKPELIHRADLRLSDIARELDKDWVLLAQQLDVPEQDTEQIKAQTACDASEQARMMLRLWLQKSGPKATGNELEKGLRKINREDIINSCMFNVELVTDDVEKAVAKVHLDQSGFDVFKEELGSSREASMRRGASLDVSYDEQDIMKEAESAAETSSETGSLFERDQLSQALTDDKDECAKLSVHETVLSVNDSTFNSNKPGSADSVDSTKSVSKSNDWNSSKTDSNYSNGFSSYKIIEDPLFQKDTYVSESDKLLLLQSGTKLHEFWPPGMIKQTDTDIIDPLISSDISNSLISTKSPSDNYNKNLNVFEQNIKNDFNLIDSSNGAKREENQILKENSDSAKLAVCEDMPSYEVTDIVDQSLNNFDDIFSKNTTMSPLLNKEESYTDVQDVKEDAEYIAVLEPDTEFSVESSSNITFSSESLKPGCKGMLIEEVSSTNGLFEPHAKETVIEHTTFNIPTDNLCTGFSNRNKGLFMEADRNLFPILEIEKDETDVTFVPNSNSYEKPVSDTLNSCNILQSKSNPLNSKFEIENEIPNGFKSGISLETTDLGYFSLDKESNLTNVSSIPDNAKQVESAIIISVTEGKNNPSENIPLNLSPDVHNSIVSINEELTSINECEKLNVRDRDLSNVKEFHYFKDFANNNKIGAEILGEEFDAQLSKYEEYSPGLSSKNDPLVQELSEIVKSGDYSCSEGGIEIEKLRQISALLPEIRDSELQKPTETEFRNVEVTIGENVVMTTVQEIPAKLTESETWPSGDLDTSQVSVSSLPDDEKSEPTTAIVSSTTAVTVDVIKKVVPDTDPSSRPVSDFPDDMKETFIDKKEELVYAETVSKSLESPLSDLDTALKSADSTSAALESVKEKEPAEHVQQLPSETLISKSDVAPKEDSFKADDVNVSEKEDQLIAETQYTEKSDSSFIPCAFINTAFAGAELIDEVEQDSPIRARSPYEVIRGETDKITDITPEEKKDITSPVERVSYITRHVEIRRRPVLQHIPSEISEEDLVEREITSPIGKEEMESFVLPTDITRDASEDELSDIKVVRTVTTTKIIRSSEDYGDNINQVTKPDEILESKISSNVERDFNLPTSVESRISEDESTGMKVVKTITTTIVRAEDHGEIEEPQALLQSKILYDEEKEPKTFEMFSNAECIVPEDESSKIKVIKTITTTRVVKSSEDFDDATSQAEKTAEILEREYFDDKEKFKSSDIPASVETKISEDESSGMIVKTITTTRLLGHSGDFDDSSDQITEPQELLESKKFPSVKEELKAIDKSEAVASMISDNDSSDTKIVKTITTTRIIKNLGESDDNTGQISETCEILQNKISEAVKDTPVSIESVVSEENSSGLRITKSVTTTQVIRSSENDDDLSLELQEILDAQMPPDEIKIKKETSEYTAKTDDITTPESDTGIPTSPFELISESEISEGDHKSSTFPLSQSYPKSEKDEKSQDSVITTSHSQSVTEKTVSISIASSKDQTDSYTLNELPETSESKVIAQIAVHTTVMSSDCKPLTNGPGEVEYHEEYDYDEEIDKKYITRDTAYSTKPAGESSEAEESKQCHYGSLSDDVIDSEIRDILDSDQQLEDIIERPDTPEPPKDDGRDLGFMERNLKRPSEEAIEGLIRDSDFTYSDDAALSPSSPDSKAGFAYGMQFEKYDLDQAEEAMDVDSDQYSEEKEPFNYGMRFERDPDLDDEDIPCYGDLYTHEEEDEDALENGEKVKVILKPVKDSDFDILAGRKYFTKNVEIDELSMSSLQEFERLEDEIVCGRKSSIGSMDSLNGKQAVSKSGEHDDVSMSSLTEFERIERECTEGDKIDPSMQESITQLSEIEEGHESQASEASQENKSDAGKEDDVSILEDYNDELENIEEIILKGETKKTDELPFQFMLKQSQKTELVDSPEIIYKDDKLVDNKLLDSGKQKSIKSNVTAEVTRVSGWTTSKSIESSSLGDAKEDLDQDSLRDEISLKPDSLIDDGKLGFQDSLHEERFDDADSLQEENLDEMHDSLFEERLIEDDSLHEMDIMPDESSLSLEGSLPAIASLDSSKADDPVKVKVIHFKDSKETEPALTQGAPLEVFHLEGKTQINVTDLQRGVDVMQSSTDSLEQSSSAALAAFQVESESLMSSSLNSAITSEDYTMISSTDTLEQEGRITYRYEDIPVDDIELLVRGGHRVIVDSEGNIQTVDGKQFIETDEITNRALGFSKDVTEIKLPPTSAVQVHSALTTVKYVNGHQKPDKSNIFSDQETDYTSFESSHFDPDVEVEEIETTDEFGNTKIIRKIKKVSHTKAQFSSSSSSKDVEEKLKEFLREHTAGDDAGTAKEEIEEERTTDDKGNVVVIRTIKQQVLTEPEVHSQTFTGPNADQQSQEFVETFQTLNPTEDISEYEKVDEQGNVVRVTQKFVVTPQVHTVSFSGPDAHKQMEEYMRQWTLQSQSVGEFEGDQHRTTLPALQMSRSSEQSGASIPTDASENLVHKVIGDTVVTKTVLSTFSTDSPEKIVKPESSTSASLSLETERVKPSDCTDDKTSTMPK